MKTLSIAFLLAGWVVDITNRLTYNEPTGYIVALVSFSLSLAMLMAHIAFRAINRNTPPKI